MFRTRGIFFLCLAVGIQGAKVTPMEKVIFLLKGLSAKVEAEGKKEAAQYDKFACFCKEQADEKLYGIEKSDAKIAGLQALIKSLDADIAGLNGDVSELSKKISGLDSEIKKKTEKRDKENTQYQKEATDLTEAIDACGAAIDALKASKDAMSGAKLSNLLQVKTMEKAVARLGQAPKFQYQSNDIIATIEGLMATFKKMKKELDFTEHDTNSAFEKNKLGLSNEKKFSEKEKAEKQAIIEQKTEDRQTADQEKTEETKDRNSDDAFMKELTAKCEKTAELFDQRSSNRADELKALSDATAELKKGAAPNFSANKKLVGLQTTATASKAASKKPVALVQIRHRVQHDQAGRQAVLHRVQTFLNAAADRTGSRYISSLAARVYVAKDHFVKVRALIKDLLAKLKADALSEATQKGNCDKGMKKAVSDRDKANNDIEAATAKLTTANSKKSDLKAEIATLSGQVAQLKKTLLQAAELRADEKADNTKTMTMSKEGAESVKLALKILKGFYEGQFMQKGKYTPPNADRQGKTVGDLAPEFAAAKYKGAQSESKGIIGILDVMLSDFDRTWKKTESDENSSQGDFDKLKADTDADVDKKNARIKKAEGDVADAKAEILAQEQALKDAKELLEGATDSLENLQAMCVKGEETWKGRSTDRKAEIEALKEALAIFENWQN